MSSPEPRVSSLAQARIALDQAATRDRGRLLGLWAKCRAKPGDAGLREALAQALQASLAARAARAAQLPTASINEALPIAAHAQPIVDLIRQHPVVVVAGETGSGKTTQLPKLCLLAGRGAAGMIGCTQPRRIAARAVARRVAEELQVPLGGVVGYQVRFADNVSDATAIKFMTDGILLAETASDRWLSRYDTLIIDEAHERSLNIDFLLGYLKNLLPRRPDLKVVVTSATIDTERFSTHFGDAPVVNVEGRGYPVEIRYRPLQSALQAGQGVQGQGDEEQGGERTLLDGIVAACDEIARERSGGDTLIFLPGEREIRDAHQALERRKYRHTEIMPLYARLSAREQDRVFHPGTLRRIVLATNVAETSLTVPRIHSVIDPGVARVKRYSARQKLDRLHIEDISQASADQRAGRCGRVAPGTCYRLYSQADFESRPRYTDPEIRRAALAGVILRMLALGLGDIERFPFLEPPDPRAIADGWQHLSELGAIDAQRALTATGRAMAKLPVDVKLARMLIAAHSHGCLREMLVIAAFLGVQDPRERPADARAAADNAHAQFADARSEFVGILKLWQAYRQAHQDLTQSQLRKWADKQYLGFLRLREWWELHRQLKLQCAELGWQEEPPLEAETDQATPPALPPARYAALHRALIAGLPTQIGHLAERGLYDGPRGRKFGLFPGSNLARKPPAWVLSAMLLDTEKVWALTNAAIEPEWAIAELPHLLARRHFDPRWSRSQGRVIGSEQISLFGLVLAPKKPVHYGALFPEEARGIFVREGLVPGEINTRSGFLQRNLRTLVQAKDEEAKLRRAGLVVDEEWQAQWYLQRLPADVHNAHALDAWYRKLPAAQKAALEWTRDDLLVVDQTDAALFPDYLALGDARLAVRYRFEPGAADDGMTLAVPLSLLNALDAARLSWLAPGLVADKAAGLIKTLPKPLRRNFVPAPDFARAFFEAHRQPEADAMESALARFLKRLTGVMVTAADFDADALEPHLRMNLQLFDDSPHGQRHVLAQSRDLQALRAQFGQRAADAFATRAAQGLAQTGLTAFPALPIPEQVTGAGGVPAYPALEDTGEAAALNVHAERAVAQRLHLQGVRRLLRIALADKIKQARRQLPAQPKTALLYAAIESTSPRRDGLKDGDRLREDLVEGAFAALSADGLDTIRSREAFDQRAQAIGRELFAEATRRLRQAEAILQAIGALRAQLESPLMGWASGNLDDMRAHLASLAPPGFLRDVPEPALANYPRYLKALSVRAERALRDPVRDQQRMLDLKPFSDALDEAIASGRMGDALWQTFRWELEELRVATFAQELAGRGTVSAKKLATALAALRSAED